MNPVFVFLVIVAAAGLWLLLARAFRFIGGAANKITDNVKDAMFSESDEDKLKRELKESSLSKHNFKYKRRKKK